MIRYLVVFTLIYINSIVKTNAQLAYLNESYFINNNIINPAITGSENYPVASYLFKKQWLGIKNSPSTQILSWHFRVGHFGFYDPKMYINKSKFSVKERNGLGFTLINDTDGPTRYSNLMLYYSYHVPLTAGRLSFGLSANLGQYMLDIDDLSPNNNDDPLLQKKNNIAFLPNANFGIYFYHQNYFAGFSATELFKTSNSVIDIDYMPGLHVIGGYRFKLNSNFYVEPSTRLYLIDMSQFQYDIFSKIYYKRFHWISAGYRSVNALKFNLGIKVTHYIHIGYSYEAGINQIGLYNIGTHEISIGFNIGLRAAEYL